jgi:hypothetical protein
MEWADFGKVSITPSSTVGVPCVSIAYTPMPEEM